jgi:hypothetical protein
MNDIFSMMFGMPGIPGRRISWRTRIYASFIVAVEVEAFPPGFPRWCGIRSLFPTDA